MKPEATVSNLRPTCDTPGCGRPIPKGGESSPEICTVCLAALKAHDVPRVGLVDTARRQLVEEVSAAGVEVVRIDERIAELKHLVVLAGYELLGAKQTQRDRVRALDRHDLRRSIISEHEAKR